ncbi:MAG: nicotinate (nicotinamide) nucleotide adenylyltransferase [Ruminococcaceae bacterium]|nr:nicotinate (nicotinamide) nucleotide adenylyltransferase [Oscillospiraceae bacterium]
MEVLGLYGGTFGPPHMGHIHAAEAFLAEIPMDKLLIMPTFLPPHKVKAKGDTPALRYEMCLAAFGNLAKTEISDYEIRKADTSYTVETLRYLHSCGEREIYMLCGTDMFLTLDTWNRAEEIFQSAHIVCIPRYTGTDEELHRKKEEYEQKYKITVRILQTVPIELSSTDVRSAIRNGEDLTDLVPASVAAICKREQLYRD